MLSPPYLPDCHRSVTICPFVSTHTGIGQTDRQTEGIGITISRSACIGMLTRDKTAEFPVSCSQLAGKVLLQIFGNDGKRIGYTIAPKVAFWRSQPTHQISTAPWDRGVSVPVETRSCPMAVHLLPYQNSSLWVKRFCRT